MASSPENSSELTPEQRTAFRVINFNGFPVKAVVAEGERNLPYGLGKDPEVKMLFDDMRNRYEEWSFMCGDNALFNEKTAALLLSIGVLTPNFFSTLLRKIRFEKYKKHLARLFRGIGQGDYLEDYFEPRLQLDPQFHQQFVKTIYPRIGQVFQAFTTDVRFDIESPQGKLRFLDDILELLEKTDVEKVFSWSEEDRQSVITVLTHLRESFQELVRSGILQELALNSLDAIDLDMDGLSDEERQTFSDFLEGIEDRFGTEQQDGPPRFDAGHGWKESDSGEGFGTTDEDAA